MPKADLFKDIIPSILKTKVPVLENEKDYVPFLVNKALSYHYDCILLANEMNSNPHLDGRMQYDYLINTVRSYRRPFNKWHKLEPDENVEALRVYYGFSTQKAKEALSIISEDDLLTIKKSVSKGGFTTNGRKQ